MAKRQPSSGGAEALAEAYDRYGARLYGYALTIVGERDAAEEVVQEVFCRLAARGAFFGVRDVEAYLFRVARNEALRWIARRPKREVDGDNAPEPAAPVRDPSEQDRREAVLACLSKLPSDQAEVVHLKVYEQMTFDQIAELTGASANTVASRWRYACEKLRHLLRPDSPL